MSTSDEQPAPQETTGLLNAGQNGNSLTADTAVPATTPGTMTTTDQGGMFARMIHDLEDSVDESKRNLKSELEEAQVPVFHTFLVKSIKDSDGGPQVVGTFVQQIFGIPPPKEDMEADPPVFAYRFNEEIAKDDLVDLRRTEYSQAKFHEFQPAQSQTEIVEEGGQPGLSDVWVSRSTFQIKAPLELDLEFDAFPFTVMRGRVDIEMSTREDKRQKNVRLRPTFLLHNKDRRNNVCIQEATGVEDFAKQSHKAEKALTLKLDGLDELAMISPYPEVTYFYDKKKKYCPRFSVSFWLVEEGMPKFIRIILPMVLICAMNTINVINDWDAWKNQTDESNNEGIDRYLNNAATLALTAVFILPEIAPARNNPDFLSMNDMYVLLVFLALTLSSIPPRLIDFPGVGFIGMAIFWLSFGIPLWNLIRYWRLVRKVKDERHAFVKARIAQGEGHPFYKEKSYKAWSGKKGIVDRDFKFVGEYVEGNETEVTDEGGNKYTIAKPGKRLELSY